MPSLLRLGLVVALAAPGAAYAHPSAEAEIRAHRAEVAARPADPAPRRHLARELLNLRRPTEALRALPAPHRRAAADWRLAAEAHLAGGDRAAAEAAFGQTLRRAPEDVPARLGRARLREARGALEAARVDFRAAAEAAPAAIDARLGWARTARRGGRLDEARRALTGDVAVLWRARAELELAAGRPDAARAAIAPWLTRAKVRTRPLLLEARALEAAGDASGALQRRREALREADRAVRRRGSAASLALRARAHLALGDRARARADADAALARAPGWPEAQAVLQEVAR